MDPSALEAAFRDACDDAVSRLARGDTPGAIAALREAVRLKPAFRLAWANLARLFEAAGDRTALAETLAAATQALPGDADFWVQLGYAHASLRANEAALEAFARAGSLTALAPHIEVARSMVELELGDTAAALRTLGRAGGRDPEDLHAAMADRLLLPQVYESAAQARQWRERFDAGLARLEAEVPRWRGRADGIFATNQRNFLLAYQGEDDLDLQRRYSGFVASLAREAEPRWFAPRERTLDGQRRARVAFVSEIFHECTAGYYFERWVTGLDRERFEVLVCHTGAQHDALTDRIAASVDRFVTLRGGAHAVASFLEQEALDAIVYPEVGMVAMNYVLAALRLAPVQLAGWGHPVTTGSSMIDGYFTPGEMEPQDAEAHYSERLIRLPGLGVDYARPPPGPPIAREQIGLPADRRVYLCTQSLFKVHPDTDALLVSILERDPEGVVALFQGTARRLTEQVGARLVGALTARGIAPRKQVRFLPRLSPGAFRSAVALADVVVDPPRWSGGNTSLDCLAAGTPVVAIEGRFMRARQTAAMLRALSLGELVAGDAEAAARIAVEVATEGDRNRALRATIAGRSDTLFGQHATARAFADALWKAVTGQ